MSKHQKPVMQRMSRYCHVALWMSLAMSATGGGMGCGSIPWPDGDDSQTPTETPTPTVTPCPDVDGDGVCAQDNDCDDTNAAVNPDATEVCDEDDNNCDHQTDEGCNTWYLDQDQDGFGDPDVTSVATTQPEGYVNVAGDCDDLNKNINPSATEVCDEVDNNCDGHIDESTSEDALTWYADVDQDGYGSAVVTAQSCEQPTGFTASSDDCDDTNGTINPAASEQCDQLDNDCDGKVDDNCWDGTDARWDESVWQ